MLSTDYFVTVNMASRKFSGLEFRYQTVRNLLGYNLKVFDILDSSRILLDAAGLLGLVTRKLGQPWKFTDLKTLDLQIPDNADEEARQLAETVKQKIEVFKQHLFTDYAGFEKFWLAKSFVNATDYLDEVYHYLPYVWLGIDDEEPVAALYQSAESVENINQVKLGFARKTVLLRRMKEVILKKQPDDLPESVAESLIDYALRISEDTIPLKTAA